METTIEPERAGELCLRHRLIATEPIASPPQFKPAVAGTGRSQLTFRCSSCNRLKVNGAWQELEQAIEAAKGQPTLDYGVMRVAYSICGHCRSMANRPPFDVVTRTPAARPR